MSWLYGLSGPIFYWTGVLVWCAIACYAIHIFWLFAKGLWVAIDWMLWRSAIHRIHGRYGTENSGLLHRSSAFLKLWLRFTVSSGDKFYAKRGRWEGYRKWTVYPVESAAAASSPESESILLDKSDIV